MRHNITRFLMMRLLIFLSAAFAVAWTAPADSQCNVDEAHVIFGTPSVIDHDVNSLSVTNFELSVNDIEEGFLPEIEYEVSLKSNDDLFQKFIISALNDDPYCDHGTIKDKYDIGSSDDSCPHVITQALVTDMRRVTFNWKAPECGCVTFRATLKAGENVYSEVSFEKGALMKEFCVTGMNKPEDNPADMEEEPLVEEPSIDVELYDIIERLCEEGNFRGAVLPDVIQECCTLPAQQRRMCLVRVIPAEENDAHRLESFCSKMIGNFFEGHPVLANAEGVRRCCELTSNPERMVCLSEEKMTHYDEICSLNEGERSDIEGVRPGRSCCELEGQMRYNCMERKALREKEKKRLERRRTLRRKTEKVKSLCNAVDQSPVGERGSEDYEICCTVEDVEDALTCFKDVEKNSFDGLCRRQSVRFDMGRKLKIHPCCGTESDARYECFLEKRGNNLEVGNNAIGEQGQNPDRSGVHDSNRPSWMQRTCMRLKNTDNPLKSCCRNPTFLEKKKCIDSKQNALLVNICSSSNETVSYAIFENENLNAAVQTLNPAHECCVLEGNRRLACIKEMKRSLAQMRREESTEDEPIAEPLRVPKEGRWQREEARQNVAICATVREGVEIVDKQVVRCCEMDGEENQRECLAVLRRDHFTAVCDSDVSNQINIFNIILRTEEAVNDDHRCCIRPNADIRAACFSRVDRQVAMLSYTPPGVVELQDLRTELVAVAELNRIDAVCEDIKTASSKDLRGRWPVQKCCRYRNNRRYTCLMTRAREMADQSCDGPTPRVYFPVGFYGELIDSDYTGPFLDPLHPCCVLTGDVRHECIKDASMAIVALRVPAFEVKPLEEFFKVTSPESRFDTEHQDAICSAATDFIAFYNDLENGLDVEVAQPFEIQVELQELHNMLADEFTDAVAEQEALLAEQNEQTYEEEEEEEEEDEEEEDDRRRKRRQATKFVRPSAKKVRASASGLGIDEVNAVNDCCDLHSTADGRLSCMTSLWVTLLNQACIALPELPPSSETDFGSNVGGSLLPPAPLEFGGRGDIQNTRAIISSSADDEYNFRQCCALSDQAQLDCFQNHYSPNVPAEQMESVSTGDQSQSYGSDGFESDVSESEGFQSEGSESEDSESEDSDGEESEGPQEQMESEAEEPESEEVDDSGEASEGSEMEMSENGSTTGSESVALGLTDIEGSESQDSQGETEEPEESEGPEEVMQSDGQDSESNTEEEEEEEEEDSEGEEEPQEEMESEMPEELELESHNEGESENNEEEPQEQIESGGSEEPEESEGQDFESEMEDPEQSESVEEPVEIEAEEPESEEDKDSEDMSEGIDMPESGSATGSESIPLETMEGDAQDQGEESQDEPGDSEGLEGVDGSETSESESSASEASDSEGSEGYEGSIEGEGSEGENNVGQVKLILPVVTEAPEEEEEEEEVEETGGWWGWWSGDKKPLAQVEEEEDRRRRKRDADEDTEESDGVMDPQKQMESEGQEEEEEDDDRRRKRYIWSFLNLEESEGLEAEESEGAEIEESEGSESEGQIEPQEQNGEEEEEEEEDDDDDRRKKRNIWSFLNLEESEVEESEGQDQEESEGTESEGQVDPQEQNAGEAEEMEEEEEEEDDRRKKRDIWSAMELLNEIEAKQNANENEVRRGTKEKETARRNHKDGSRQRSSILAKLSLLKILFKNEFIGSVCPSIKTTDSIQSLVSSLSEITEDAEVEVSRRRKDYPRRRDFTLIKLKECCAINSTDETVACITEITETVVDGMCQPYADGIRPHPSMKRFMRECCNETAEERYSCARGYLGPVDEIKEVIESNMEESDPLGLFDSVSKAVNKFFSQTDNEEDEEQEEEEHEEDVGAQEIIEETDTALHVEEFSWDNIRDKTIYKMCCQVGKMTGALLGQNGAVTCERSAKIYATFVEDTMQSQCFIAYNKCCGRTEQ